MADRKSSMGREKRFLMLHGTPEGGRLVTSNDYVFICRVCQITSNDGLTTEEQWLRHLLSTSHQTVHKNHQLLRKVLWDLDRTIAISRVSGLNQNKILRYICQSGVTVVDFSYLSAKSGGTAKVSEVGHLVNAPSHSINEKTIIIREIDGKQKNKFLSEDPRLQGRYQIIDVEHKLIIVPTMEEDAGLFTCSVPELFESHDFNVVANVYFKFNPTNIYLVEGQRLKIHCLAYGTNPEITWTVGNQTYNESSGNIILQPDWEGIQNAILVIQSVAYADRKIYNCTATNLGVQFGNVGYEEAVESTLVRIREKMAPLWPVCGIACEVVVLFLIFFIYEKTRDKEESEENADARDFVENSYTIATQKLRESKWFGVDESRILCAVIECGFIVETREGQENDGWFGVAVCKTSKDKKPKPENVEIFTIKSTEKRFKLIKLTLAQLCEEGYIVRINNFGDKEKTAHSERDIKSQVSFAQKAKQMLWHNSQHFAYWCRYGHRQEDVRRKQMSECVKWGSVGMNAGMIILMNRE